MRSIRRHVIRLPSQQPTARLDFNNIINNMIDQAELSCLNLPTRSLL